LELEPHRDLLRLIAGVQEAPRGLETPATIFAAIDRAVGVRSGALLLPDHADSVFSPWVLRNVGPTTEHRLRPPFELIAQTATDSDTVSPQLLAPYVSLQDRDNLDHGVLTPFVYAGTAHGLLVVFDSPYSVYRDKLELMLAAVADRCAVLLARTRTGIFSSTRQVIPLEQSEFLQAAQQLSDKTSQTGMALTCIVVRYWNAIDLICEQHAELDRRRVVQDLEAVLTATFAGVAALTQTKDGRLAALMVRGRAPDHELLEHQLATLLGRLFPSLEDQAAIRLEALSAGTESGEFAAELAAKLT